MFYLRRLQKGYVLHSGTFDTYKVKIDFKRKETWKFQPSICKQPSHILLIFNHILWAWTR